MKSYPGKCLFGWFLFYLAFIPLSSVHYCFRCSLSPIYNPSGCFLPAWPFCTLEINSGVFYMKNKIRIFKLLLDTDCSNQNRFLSIIFMFADQYSRFFSLLGWHFNVLIGFSISILFYLMILSNLVALSFLSLQWLNIYTCIQNPFSPLSFLSSCGFLTMHRLFALFVSAFVFYPWVTSSYYSWCWN